MEKVKETRKDVLDFLQVNNGDGYGDGSGSGDGYGDGYGYGDDIRVVNGVVVHKIDEIYTLIDGVHGNFAQGRMLNSDLTTTPCYVARYGNCFAHGETLDEAFHDAREKFFKNAPVESRIASFNAQFPDRDKKVPASELFSWHNILTGSCLMGRKHFCDEHGIDYEGGRYTVNEFISLTRDAYGGIVIRQLEDSKP